jgi:hypothetical protein
MNLLAALIVFARSLVSSVGCDPQVKYTQSGDAYYESAPKVEQDKSSALPTSPSQAESSERKGEQDYEGNRSDEGWSVVTNIIATVITAVATGVMAWFTISLTRYTKLLWTSGEKHSERELRAYVFYESADIARPDDFSEITARVKILNSGQTPAYRVRHSIAVIVADHDLVDFPVPQMEASEMSLGPQVKYTMERRLILDRQQQADVRGGTKRIYVFGRINYVDTFKNQQFTNFRMYYSIRGKLGILPEDSLPVEPCSGGNDEA